jgi:hypothetical protein
MTRERGTRAGRTSLAPTIDPAVLELHPRRDGMTTTAANLLDAGEPRNA